MKTTITCFLILISQASNSQPVINNLVFEGAGIRGIAYSGAIRVLEEKNLLKNVEKVGGTSAGAITALLLSLGYTSSEITNIINSTSFKKFNDGFFPGGFSRFKNYFGWYKGKKFENWLSNIIEQKTGNDDITFAGLHEQGYKDLYVTGTCLNQQKLVVFSNENYPHMKVKDAVRISSSIPFYFEAVFLDKNGNVVHRPKDKTGLDVMIDGGFTANFPIRLFDSSKYLDQHGPNVFIVNPFTLGFRIDREEQIANDYAEKGLAPVPVTSLKDYFSAFYIIVLENLNRQSLTASDWQRTVSISDGNIEPRIRKLTPSEINTLTSAAEQATTRHLR